MEVGGGDSKKSGLLSKGVLLCALCIFMGGAAECTMSQWASGFIENALGVPKLLGDTLGVVLFALLLGTGRTLYAKYGGEIIAEKKSAGKTVTVGSKVKVFDTEFEEEMDFRVVGSAEADPANGLISDESPVGKALLGKKVGEVVKAEAPDGEIEFKIIAISK